MVGEFTTWPPQPEQASRWHEHYRPRYMRQLSNVLHGVMQVKRGDELVVASANAPEGQHEPIQPPVKTELEGIGRLAMQLAIIDGMHNHQPPRPMV